MMLLPRDVGHLYSIASVRDVLPLDFYIPYKGRVYQIAYIGNRLLVDDSQHVALRCRTITGGKVRITAHPDTPILLGPLDWGRTMETEYAVRDF